MQGVGQHQPLKFLLHFFVEVIDGHNNRNIWGELVLVYFER